MIPSPAAADTQRCRYTSAAHEENNRDGRRSVRSRGQSSRGPIADRITGSSVTAAATETSGTSTPPYPTLRSIGTGRIIIDSRPIATVSPENTTARPACPIATVTASAFERPAGAPPATGSPRAAEGTQSGGDIQSAGGTQAADAIQAADANTGGGRHTRRGRTTKTHVSHIMTKLGARDRAQLVVVAYESGLVVPGATPALRGAARPHPLCNASDMRRWRGPTGVVSYRLR
jgi:hypothetical protein